MREKRGKIKEEEYNITRCRRRRRRLDIGELLLVGNSFFVFFAPIVCCVSTQSGDITHIAKELLLFCVLLFFKTCVFFLGGACVFLWNWDVKVVTTEEKFLTG